MTPKNSSESDPKSSPSCGDEGSRKDRLIKLLNEAESVSAPLQNAAQEIVDIARQQRDLAFALKQVVVESDPGVFAAGPWVRVAGAWEQQNQESRKAAAGLVETYGVLVANITTTGTSTSTAVVSTMLMPTLDAIRQFQQVEAVSKVDAVLKRPVSMDSLRSRFVTFHLDKQHGEIRSALDLLNDAYLNLRRPSREEPSPSSILIPLRQAILVVVDELLKRIPYPQESSKGISGKIMLLGKRCARGGYSQDFFESLGANARDTVDHLSSAGKDRILTRAELTVLFDSGLLLLHSLLQGMDAKKLRAP